MRGDDSLAAARREASGRASVSVDPKDLRQGDPGAARIAVLDLMWMPIVAGVIGAHVYWITQVARRARDDHV